MDIHTKRLILFYRDQAIEYLAQIAARWPLRGGLGAGAALLPVVLPPAATMTVTGTTPERPEGWPDSVIRTMPGETAVATLEGVDVRLSSRTVEDAEHCARLAVRAAAEALHQTRPFCYEDLFGWCLWAEGYLRGKEWAKEEEMAQTAANAARRHWSGRTPDPVSYQYRALAAVLATEAALVAITARAARDPDAAVSLRRAQELDGTDAAALACASLEAADAALTRRPRQDDEDDDDVLSFSRDV